MTLSRPARETPREKKSRRESGLRRRYEIYAKKDTLVLRELVVREKATIADPGVKKFFKILAECPDDVTKHILTYCRW